ncbi:thioredoxin-like protein [Russula aff. rugulosa BPL654]|nr:thioredoxin-like protein [Russula aff. rugulosa BPL654]
MFRYISRLPLAPLTRGSPTATSSALRRLLSTEARTQIQKAIDASPLVLFMKGTPDLPQCGFSRAVIQVLDIHGVPPEKMRTYDVLEDPELRSGIKEFSDWRQFPNYTSTPNSIGGCDIVLGMHQSGELEELLRSITSSQKQMRRQLHKPHLRSDVMFIPIYAEMDFANKIHSTTSVEPSGFNRPRRTASPRARRISSTLRNLPSSVESLNHPRLSAIRCLGFVRRPRTCDMYVTVAFTSDTYLVLQPGHSISTIPFS